MTATRPQTLTRALVGLLSFGVLLTPALVPSADAAKTKEPKARAVTAPNVFYPVKNRANVRDLGTSSRKHFGTDITATCNAGVFAAHPGVAAVSSAPNLGNYVRIVANGTKGLTTTYAYLSRVLVQPGQPVQAGQAIGQVGRKPGSSCQLWFSVTRARAWRNASTWLNQYVGKPPPVQALFGTRGFLIASFNFLGASHTTRSSRYASGNARLNNTMSMVNGRRIDVIGAQEFQGSQYNYWLSRGHGNTFGIYFWNGKRRDTDNAIMWRKSTIDFVSGETFDIPYFNGNTRHVPAVLLRERSSGRTFYVLNVHNPADTKGNAARYRARALAIEKQKVIDLRATGRPVFLIGDFNDREKAFCPLTANKLMISPNSIPSMTCAYPPKPTSIDWIFAAGQVRFSSWARDLYPRTARISDHPIVQARAHLQD